MKFHKIDCDDGSILFEWIHENHRFAISIEEDITESSWYFVSKDGTIEGEVLPEELLEVFKKYYD